MAIDCKSCSTEKPTITNIKTSLLSALLVVIIPKCSICVMAYSSAIALCGGESFYHQSNNWVSYIPLFLSALIVTLIVKNWRGTRSILALTLALSGLLMIVGSHQLIIASHYYEIGSVLLFISVWFNSNLLHTIQLIQRRFRKEEQAHA